MTRPPRIYFVAAEASGDLLAREVIERVSALEPSAQIAAIGGSEVGAAGFESPIDVSRLSVLGLFEGLKSYPVVVRLADAAADHILAFKPDVVVLVDSWGFMLRVAQRIRKRDPSIRLVKLIGPQVWATRPGRAGTLAAAVDHLLCMHEIEVPFYKPFGLKTTVIGNPALSRTQKGDASRFRQAHNLDESSDTILVLPGSRRSEIERVAPVLIGSARALKRLNPTRQIVVAPAASVASLFETEFPDVSEWATVSTAPEERYDAMSAATLALACSGTVTSEVAMQQTPMIVGYKTGWITWMLARGLLYKKVHITLLNILSDDREIVPEFVQTQFTSENVMAAAETLLSNKEGLAAQLEAQNGALARMMSGDRDAAEISATAILDEARMATTRG